MLVLLPLQVLSGAMTPRESMPEIIQTIMQARDQRADPGAVGLCHARVDPDRVRGWGGRELAF
ncbi:hypothetical protein [Paenirhodobacter enshiensis]|uniref:hypothetical protein n=1 Tax=Paenirhodobacter enshiensis TaxID=1105367 RepID=UPI0040407980